MDPRRHGLHVMALRIGIRNQIDSTKLSSSFSFNLFLRVAVVVFCPCIFLRFYSPVKLILWNSFEVLFMGFHFILFQRFFLSIFCNSVWLVVSVIKTISPCVFGTLKMKLSNLFLLRGCIEFTSSLFI